MSSVKMAEMSKMNWCAIAELAMLGFFKAVFQFISIIFMGCML